jgi:undecaprenyl-diphosphatase
MIGADRAVFHWINRWPGFWEAPMRFFSEGLNYPWVKALLGVMLLAMILSGKQTRRAAVLALIAVPLSNFVTDLFKKGIPMPRPLNDPSLTDCIMRVGYSDSAGTASAHSANMMAAGVMFLIHLRWFGAPWFALAVFVGLSRIYNGAHYPSQVLLGWVVGAFMAISVHLVAERIRKRKEQKASQTDLPVGTVQTHESTQS